MERWEEWVELTHAESHFAGILGPKLQHCTSIALTYPSLVSRFPLGTRVHLLPGGLKFSGEGRWKTRLSLWVFMMRDSALGPGSLNTGPPLKWGFISDAWLYQCWPENILSSLKGLQILPLLNPEKNGKARWKMPSYVGRTWGKLFQETTILKGISASSLYILPSGDKQFHNLLSTGKALCFGGLLYSAFQRQSVNLKSSCKAT